MQHQLAATVFYLTLWNIQVLCKIQLVGSLLFQMSLLLKAAGQGVSVALVTGSRAPASVMHVARSLRQRCSVNVRQMCSQTSMAKVFVQDNIASGSQLIYNNKLLTFIHQGIYQWSVLPILAIATYYVSRVFEGQPPLSEPDLNRSRLFKWGFYAYCGLMFGIMVVSSRSLLRIYYTPSTGVYTAVRGRWNTSTNTFDFQPSHIVSRHNLDKTTQLLHGNVEIKRFYYNLSSKKFTSPQFYKQFHGIKA